MSLLRLRCFVVVAALTDVVQAELRHRRDIETERLKALPEWKRHLLTKRREHDAA